MRVIAYALLTILLVPLYLMGTVCYFVPLHGRRGRVSGTAYEPFTGRLLFDLIGQREDPWARKLAPGLPATNAPFMALIMYPMAWASRVTGFTPNAYTFPTRDHTQVAALLSARTRFMDEALDAFVTSVAANGDVGQIVVLGAGWDTRLYSLQSREALRLFEVDAPATQQEKLTALERTGIDASGITFVSCDFDSTPWMDALVANGFDSRRRTLVLWEGVSMYLDGATVAATFDAFAELPAGSCIAFDVFLRPWLDGTRMGRSAKRGVRIGYGETFTWSLPVETDLEAGARRLLRASGLRLERARAIGPADCPAYGVLEAVRG